MAKCTTPNASDTYIAFRAAATAAGLGSAFRDVCMLVGAPSGLEAFFQVAKNLQTILKLLPAEWDISADGEMTQTSCGDYYFPGWLELMDWTLSRQNDLTILVGQMLAQRDTYEMVMGRLRIVNPLRGWGFTRFPIYSAICTTQERDGQPRKDYSLLQAQLLIARRRGLEKSETSLGSSPHIDAYESHVGVEDFAKNVKQTLSVARAVRELSFELHGKLLAAIHPERSPERFAELLPSDDNLPLADYRRDHLQAIRYYCARNTVPSEGGGGGGQRGRSPTINGYIEYGEKRFGIEFVNGDPDDGGLDISNQELIIDCLLDPEAAIVEGIHPFETAFGSSLLLTGDSLHKGTTPGRIAIARGNRFEIDAARMPWSAIHLRPKEIAGTLLHTLRSTALMAENDETIEAEHLENCALMAVCLETSRNLETAVTMTYETHAQGKFSVVAISKSLGHSRWRWDTTEPPYKIQRDPVKGSYERTNHLEYPVHPVADALLTAWKLRAWQPGSLCKRPHLFVDDPEHYKARLTLWLRELDKTNRLTLSKTAELKRSLLAQQTGGDYTVASLVLGMTHPLAAVPIHYALLSVEDAARAFEAATTTLWKTSDDANTNIRPKPLPVKPPPIAEDLYTGCEACPTLETVRNSIRLARESAVKLGRVDLRPDDSNEFIETFNQAVLYLIWHQFYAIATRPTQLAYIRYSQVSSSGFAYLEDKDDGSGHKGRLAWMYPKLLRHMREMEILVEVVRTQLQISRKLGLEPVYFLNKDWQGNLEAVEITPARLAKIAPELLFPTNTPRRVTCVQLTARGLSPEMVEVFMGHWLDWREPWSRKSSFDYDAYLVRLLQMIPGILADLGFEWPLRDTR